jgi:hypothetical protein
VFIKGDDVEVQTLSAKQNHVVAWHEGAGRLAKPLRCARAERVLAIKMNDLWPVLVFGEEK